MSKGSGKGSGKGALVAALGRAGVSLGGTVEQVGAAWQKTFGVALTSPEQVTALAGLPAGMKGSTDLGSTLRGGVTLGLEAPGVSMSRSYANGVAHHSTLYLDAHLQGKGLGKTILRNQVAAYEAHGIKSVDLRAADVGRYVWPSMGFAPSAERFAAYKSGFDGYLKARGLPASSAKSVQDIARTFHGGEHVGKAFLLSEHAPGNEPLSASVSDLRKALR